MHFLLDPGSGTCLWRERVAHEAGLEYAVNHHELELSPNLVAALDALVALADLRIDWNNPTEPGPFFSHEVARTEAALRGSVLAALAKELASLGYSLTPA